MATVNQLVGNHVREHDILPIEQRALRKRRRVCQDALLVDQMLLDSERHHKQDMAVAWLDFRKAFDLVPHKWLLRVLRAIGTAKSICRYSKT